MHAPGFNKSIIMFRLPGNPQEVGNPRSFSSYILQKQRKLRPMSSNLQSLSQRKALSFCQPTMQAKNPVLSSMSGDLAGAKENQPRRTISGRSRPDELIPPCFKFQYCVSKGSLKDATKILNSSFLVQPCRFFSIGFTPRKQPSAKGRQEQILQQERKSPRGPTPIHARPKRSRRGKERTRQELLTPWEIGDCYFESMRIAPVHP